MGLERKFERDGRCMCCCDDVHRDANGEYKFGPRICSQDCFDEMENGGEEFDSTDM